MSQNIITIIPTYNEAGNIALLIEKLFSLPLNLSVLVVDGNSIDETTDKVRELQDKYKNLYFIRQKSKLGLGRAYIEGFGYALQHGFDIVIQMDADLSHSPSCIPEMLAQLESRDLIIGSRYVKGGNVLNWSKGRIILSRLANIFTQGLLRLPINDITSGFKCTKIRTLRGIDFATLTSKGYAFQIEMVLRAFSGEFKIKEYPIIFTGRKKEKSKMSGDVLIEAFFKVLFLRLRKK